MHRNQRWLICLLLLALTVVGRTRLWAEADRSGVKGALDVSVEEVFAAWDAREDQVRSFAATWRQTEFFRRGTLPGRSTPRADAADRPAAPNQDTVVEIESELRLSGDQFYARRSGPHWQSELNEFVEGEQIAALGAEEGTLFSQAVVPVVEPRAHVLPAGRFRESRSISNLPLFLSLRARTEKSGAIDRDGAWTVAPVAVAIDGHDCVVVERLAAVYHPELAKGELRETYWVDPARDFCIRRFERTLGGLVELQVEIDYADPTQAWLPTQWKSVVYGGPEAVSSRQYEARLLTHSVNPELPARRLQAELPVGTAVENVTTREAWIIRPQGQRRIVTKEERERGATYAQLLASEPGQAALPPWQPWRALAGAAALLLSAAAVASRWRAKRHACCEASFSAVRAASPPWLAILTLASALLLGSFAAGLTASAPTCAGRCHDGSWSAYKQGTSYRMDFLMYCTYRAWSNDTNVAYAPSNSCAKGYVQVPYYLYLTNWSHPCVQYAPAGDLLWTMDSGGSYVGSYQFPCCDGLCYGVK
ncbi:MAG: hypothetical protein U0836_05115 [Pirellulales bacterium]